MKISQILAMGETQFTAEIMEMAVFNYTSDFKETMPQNKPPPLKVRPSW